MIKKPEQALLKAITATQFDHISSADTDEMAIPSYLHKNPVIRWLMWRRYEELSTMAACTGHETVLEFGCGSGVFLPQLAAMSKKVFAIDLFPEFASILNDQLHLGVQFVPDLEDIEDHGLDIIFAADVLEHIETLDYYLEIFSRKLNDKGRFLVSGPTENVFYKVGRILAGFGGKGDYHHTNINRLIENICDYGFKAHQIRYLPGRFLPHLFTLVDFRPKAA